MQPATTMRDCLGYCKKQFPSTGPGHRLCDRCRAKNEGLSRNEVRGGAAVHAAEPPPAPEVQYGGKYD